MSENKENDQSFANKIALSQEEENKWLKDELTQSNFLVKQLRQQISDLTSENKVLANYKISFCKNRIRNSRSNSPNKDKHSAALGHYDKSKLNKSDVNRFIRNSFLYPNSPTFKQPNENYLKKSKKNYLLSRESVSKLDNKSSDIISRKHTISTIHAGKGNSTDNDFSFDYTNWNQYDSVNTPKQSLSKTISNASKIENSSSSAQKNTVVKTITTQSRGYIQFKLKKPDGIIKVISVNLSDSCQKNIEYLKNQVKKSLKNSNVDLQNIKLTYCDNERDKIQLDDEDDFYNALLEAEINDMSKLDLFLSTIHDQSIENPIMEDEIVINNLNFSEMTQNCIVEYESFSSHYLTKRKSISFAEYICTDNTKKSDLNETSLISMTKNGDFNQTIFDDKPPKRTYLKRARTTEEFDKSS